MAQVRVFSYTAGPSEVMVDALELEDRLHRLYGGDRAETGAVGSGPTAQAWLVANGPPQTTGYCTPTVDESTNEVRVPLLSNVGAQISADAGRPQGQQRLTGPERAAVAQAVADAVERGRPAPGGAGGAGRGNRDGSDRGRP